MNELGKFKPTLNEKFAWEPMPDGCILYCQESGQILTLNPAAELMLSYCDGTATLEEICSEVTQESELSQDDFWTTVARCLEEKVLVVESP